MGLKTLAVYDILHVMIRLFRYFRRHKIRTLFISIAVLSILVVGGVVAINSASTDKQHTVMNHYTESLKSACSLSPSVFLKSVNQWRTKKKVSSLTYSSALQSVASSRIKDMQKYKYYGHVNPKTKRDAWFYIKPLIPSNTAYSWNEVLDGPDNAKLSVSNFQKSPEHYDALISPDFHYVGFVSVYLPESWAEYDNSGKLETKAGTTSANCLVVAVLSSVVANTNPSSVTSSAHTSGQCTTVTLHKHLTYQDVNWLPKGKQQISSGSDGSRYICGGKTVSTLEPVDEIIYVGTDDTPAPTYSPPPLEKYTYSSSRPTHTGCVSSVRSQSGGQVDAEAICTGMGY